MLLLSPSDKSVCRCRAIFQAHAFTCCPKKWRIDSNQPEILSEEQECSVLNWNRRTVLESLSTNNDENKEEEEAQLYEVLYEFLHGEKPGKDWRCEFKFIFM